MVSVVILVVTNDCTAAYFIFKFYFPSKTFSASCKFVLRLCSFVCRTLKAMATNDKDRLDIVRHAASQSDPMYQNFRDTGYFLGLSSD